MSLISEDAAIIKGMLARGDRQHDIAAYFRVNAGRIAEIATKQRFADVRAATDLPPPLATRCFIDRNTSLNEQPAIIAEIAEIILKDAQGDLLDALILVHGLTGELLSEIRRLAKND